MIAPEGIFLAVQPGLEPLLAEEAREAGFPDPRPVPGGVETKGGWAEVRRANLVLRGAGRVLARLWSFRAMHLAQLDRRLRRLPWGELIPAGTRVAVEAQCLGSRIWHEKAAAERLAGALEAAGLVRAPGGLRVMLRIEDDLCTVSLDTSGEPLHRRGFRQAVGKAPLRETLAALFLRACGYRGAEPLIDPMCGSGTIPIEAAGIAAGLLPGRGRRFAFEALAGMAAEDLPPPAPPLPAGAPILGSDRDAGAVRMALANAGRAGVAGRIRFSVAPAGAMEPPEGPPGLILVNPPYGARIGKTGALKALYGSFGAVVLERFPGWRVGLVTAEPALARATGLPFGPPGPPVPHGGLTIRLYRTGPIDGRP